jgi:hypothetical protein
MKANEVLHPGNLLSALHFCALWLIMGTYILPQACCITMDFWIKMNTPCAVNHTNSMKLVAEETILPASRM